MPVSTTVHAVPTLWRQASPLTGGTLEAAIAFTARRRAQSVGHQLLDLGFVGHAHGVREGRDQQGRVERDDAAQPGERRSREGRQVAADGLAVKRHGGRLWRRHGGLVLHGAGL